MVWGCISAYGVGSLHILKGTINAVRCIQVLEQHMFASRQCLFQRRPCIIQQDNAILQTASRTTACLRSRRVRVFNRSACSPDLSPIKNIWHVLKRKIWQRPRTVEQLEYHIGLLSTDADKAFDRVHWSFIRATMDLIGLGTSMLSWISALYSRPSVAVKVNETRFEFFDISNGTRQGCPLFPLIYILTLEPFLCKVRDDPNITGYHKSSGDHKVAAFADNLIFFLTDPLTPLPNLLKALQAYGTLSHFKINFGKSSALNISADLDAIWSLFLSSGQLWRLNTWAPTSLLTCLNCMTPILSHSLSNWRRTFCTGIP